MRTTNRRHVGACAYLHTPGMSTARLLLSAGRRLGGEKGGRRCTVIMQHIRSQTSGSEEPEVVFRDVSSKERGGIYREILLNRLKALNALNWSMARLISDQLKAAADDPSVPMVVIEGAGEKAFCAGGDIRAVTEAGKTGQPLAQEFFRDEYRLNHAISVFPKPYVALIDGITMGGGVGLSVHSPFRVATERTLFAMPETSIGLFPDVGGSFFLPRLPGRMGMFLSLTGHRLKGRDVFHAGVATHFISTATLPTLRERLAALGPHLLNLDPRDRLHLVQQLLDSLHRDSEGESPEPFLLETYRPIIDSAFSQGTVEEIVAVLQREGGEWGDKQAAVLTKMSPTSLKITHRELMKGAELSSLAECLKMEYRMSQWCMRGHDFYEGVRAVLVDRDNQAQWNPSSLGDVTEEMVSRHFQPLPSHSEWQL